MEFPSELGSAPVKLSVAGAWVGMSLDGASAPLSAAGSTASYPNALPGVDVSYQAEGGGSRESLSLANSSAPSTYSFAITSSYGVSLTAMAGGSLAISRRGAPIGVIDAPTVRDAHGAVGAATMRVVGSGGGETITVGIDPAWMTATARAFPVVIDPDVTVYASSLCTLNALVPTVYQGCGGANTEQVNNSGTLQRENGVVQFGLSSIPFDSRVTAATLTLGGTDYSSQPGTAGTLQVQSLGQAWTPSQVTWNNASSSVAWRAAGGTPASSPPTAVYNVTDAGNDATSWTYYPTQLVQAWVSGQAGNGAGASNDGLVLAETTGVRVGSGIDIDVKSATLQVSYYPYLGLSSALKYDTRRLNDRSTVYVQAANQNGVVSAQDLTVRGSGLALNVERLYNTLTQAWTFSVGQDVAVQTSTSPLNPVVQTPTGGIQTFVASSAGTCNFRYAGAAQSWPVGYTATAGGDGNLCRNPSATNQWALESHGSGEVLLFGEGFYTSPAATLTGFTTRDLLTDDIDHNGNTIAYTYNSSSALSGITDTQGRSYSVTASPGGHIAAIAGPTGSAASRTWSYGWDTSTGLLDTFTDPTGAVTHYTYNTGGVLDEVQTPGIDLAGAVVASETDLGLSGDAVTSLTQRDASCTAAGPSSTGACVTDYTVNRGSVAQLAGSRCEVSTSGTNPPQLAVCATVTDARGEQTAYGFDDTDRPLKAVDANGYGQQASFNGDSQVTSATDAVNPSNPTQYGFNAGPTSTLDQVSSATQPTGAQSSFNYTSGSGANGYQPAGTVDTQGNCSGLTYDSSSSTSYGNVTQVSAGLKPPAGGGGCGSAGTASALTKTTYQVASGGSAPTTNCGAPAHPGVVCSTTDPNGNQTTYTYDTNGNPIGSTPPGSANAGTAATAGSTLKPSSRTVDGLSRVATATDGNGDVTAYWYDGDDRPIEINDGYAGAYNPAAPPGCAVYTNCTTYTYDPDGNLVAQHDATGPEYFTYDHLNRAVTDSDYQRTVTGDTPQLFWRLGEPAGATSVTDLSGNGHTGAPYQSTGVTFAQPAPLTTDPTTAAGFGGQFGDWIFAPETPGLQNNGDFTDELWATLPANAAGQTPGAPSLPALMGQGGNTETAGGGWRIVVNPDGTFTYFRAGATWTSTTAIPATGYHHIVITYSGTTLQYYLDGTQVGTFTTTFAPTTDTGNLQVGNSNDNVDPDFDQGDIGDVAIYTTALTATQVDAHYEIGTTTKRAAYDDVGNLTTYTNPAGTLGYTYDPADNLLSAAYLTNPQASCPAEGTAAPVACVTFKYDGDHHRTGTEVPGGVTQAVTYDASGRVTGVTTTGITSQAPGVTAIPNYTYTYKNTATNTDTNLVQTTNSGGTYTYDSLNRLLSAAYNGHTWTYTYDNFGNRLTTREDAGPTSYYAYNSASQLCWTYVTSNAFTPPACSAPPAGAATYTYDHDGNQLTGPAAGAPLTATYNNQDQTTQTVGAATYPYGYAGLGQSERTVGDGITFENTPRGVTRAGTTDYLRAPSGTLLALLQPATVTSYFYLYDGRGNIAGLVDINQQQVDSYTYDPYGATTPDETIPQPFRYNAGYQDPTGLYHYGARYYDPTTGRFTQPDPSGNDPGYAYAADNPINNSDPFGEDYGPYILPGPVAEAIGISLGEGVSLSQAITDSGFPLPPQISAALQVLGTFGGYATGFQSCGLGDLCHLTIKTVHIFGLDTGIPNGSIGFQPVYIL